MPLTPVAGVTRLRAFQLGKESTFKTQVPATRRMPWSFTPTVDPHWTFPTADTGTLDQAIAPYQMALDITGQSQGQLFFNDAQVIGSAGIKGGVSVSGQTWTFQPASTSQDNFDTFTGEWFDDATADAQTYTGGLLEGFKLDYPQDMGPVTVTGDWRFGKMATYPATPTGGLTTDLAPTPVYMGDTVVYVDDAAGSIGISPQFNDVYDISVDYRNNLDAKRFANGSNSRSQVQGYSRGERVITVTITFAKASAATAEVAKWLAQSTGNPTERFIAIKTTSAVSPYVLTLQGGFYWMTRSEQTINTNTAFQLVGHQVYDSTLTYPFKMTLTNTQGTVV